MPNADQERPESAKGVNRFKQARKEAMFSEVRQGGKPQRIRDNKPVMQGLVLSIILALACAVFVVAIGSSAL